MGNVAGPIMLSIRGSEHPERVRFYVAETSAPDERSLLAEVRRDALEADPVLYKALQDAFYGHVSRLTAEAAGIEASEINRLEFPGGLHGKGRPT